MPSPAWGPFLVRSRGWPITAIVIVFEMTADFNLVLPLMIGSGIAYLIADRASSGSIYNRLLAIQGIHLEPTPPGQQPLGSSKGSRPDAASGRNPLQPDGIAGGGAGIFRDRTTGAFPL